MKDEFVFVDPPSRLPGCLVVVARQSQLGSIRQLEEARTPTRYIARAQVTDQVPLSGGPDEVMAYRPVRLVTIDRSPLALNLHFGGSNAVFFDLCADDAGFLTHIEVEVESSLPSRALPAARTALNNILDALVASVWVPLAISRLELYCKGSPTPLLFQILLPFDDQIRLGGALGGMSSIPPFSPYEALIREAVTSSSPFYRFLCAYRLYEGLGALRRTTREICKKVGVVERLPRDPRVDTTMLAQLGFDTAFLEGVRTVGDLHGKLTETRNRVAHFLLKSDDLVLNTSEGLHYIEYAVGGAALLHYAHAALVDMRRYWAENLEPRLRIGQVLPLVTNRDAFIVRSD